VEDVRFLGGAGRFRDSGMMDTAANGHPRAFWRADSDPEVFAAAVGALVDVIEEVRPQVVITYDERGGYGHPDHIMAHRVTMAAVAAAPTWRVPKVYWNAIARSAMQANIDGMRAKGVTFFDLEDAADFDGVVDDGLITTEFTAPEWAAAKIEAMRAHASQISVDGPFFALSNNLGREVWAVEQYRLVQGEAAEPFNANGHETDLFAGI
jgi:N-acetyl-1-D-myo-inositol-2-amino-2-deoxy-alpha-D-glucopyranoside deacetylase